MNYKLIYDNYKLYENGDIYNKYGKKLTPVDNGKGYLVINLNEKPKGKRTCKAIHRLLGEYFLENPENLSDINHIDGNRQNNSLENLEWCSHSDNIKHSYDLNNRSAIGVNNAKCKTDLNTVNEICFLLEQDYKPSQIRDMGYNYTLVRKIKNKQTWKHISKDYNF